MKTAITHTVPVTIDTIASYVQGYCIYALPSLDSDGQCGHMEYTYNADHSTALHMFGAFVQVLMTMLYIYPTTLTGVLRACVLCKGKRYQTSKIIIYL